MINDSYDLLVLGCGVAGLCAAVSAAERGLNVCVLERATFEERGGNTRYTEAFLRMSSESEISADFEAHFAANAGGHIDPSLLAQTLDAPQARPSVLRSLSFVDPDVLARFAEEVPPTIAWLRSLGVRFAALATPFLTRSAPKLMPVGGGLALIEALARKAEGLGVEFRYEHVGLSLLTDETGGRITGVHALAAGRRPLDLHAHNVVLASGGFQGNYEMLGQYLGSHATYLRPVARGGYYNKGEGIRMALAVGAAPCGDYTDYHAEPIDPRSGSAEPAIFIFPYGILVNRLGKRFVDEAPGPVDATYEAITRQIARQPQGIAYSIFDASLDDIPNYQVAIRSDQPAIVAATLESLADKLEIPADTLKATVAAYNAACRPGRFCPTELDGLATGQIEPAKSNFARPIERSPYRAYPIISANVFTFGGLKVDANACVLDIQGDPIEGLYAAGEVVGLYYNAYTGATSVLKGATFGRLAGMAAPAQA